MAIAEAGVFLGCRPDLSESADGWGVTLGKLFPRLDPDMSRCFYLKGVANPNMWRWNLKGVAVALVELLTRFRPVLLDRIASEEKKARDIKKEFPSIAEATNLDSKAFLHNLGNSPMESTDSDGSEVLVLTSYPGGRQKSFARWDVPNLLEKPSLDIFVQRQLTIRDVRERLMLRAGGVGRETPAKPNVWLKHATFWTGDVLENGGGVDMIESTRQLKVKLSNEPEHWSLSDRDADHCLKVDEVHLARRRLLKDDDVRS